MSNIAGFGRRLGAFIVDGAIADLISLITGHRPGHASYGLIAYAAFLAIELVFLPIAGQTPGMRIAGIVVVHGPGNRRPPWRWALVRTLLLATIVPALITDSSGRAMHDRAAGTTMVRTR